MMKKVFGLFCVSLLSSVSSFAAGDMTAPVILSLQLSKAVYAPGESLVVNFKASDDNSGVEEGCCSAVWVNPSSNVFKNSDGVNGQVKSVGGDAFVASGFPINPYVDTKTSKYTLSGFNVSDRAGNRASLSIKNQKDKFYSDQSGQMTAIAIVSFAISANPKGDTTPPVAIQASLLKQTYAPGESLVINLEASDDVSGLNEGCCSSVRVFPTSNVFRNSAGVNGSIRQVSAGKYVLSNLPINPYVEVGSGDFVVQEFSFADKAGNTTTLRLKDPTDKFYVDQAGAQTNIGAMAFQIK